MRIDELKNVRLLITAGILTGAAGLRSGSGLDSGVASPAGASGGRDETFGVGLPINTIPIHSRESMLICVIALLFY